MVDPKRITRAVTATRDERRVAPRASCRLPLALHVPTIEAAYAGEVANMSTSGMFVATAERLPLGALVDLEVTLENGQLLLHATAEVTRLQANPPGVGVRFIDISYEAQALIERMVADTRWFGDFRLQALIGQGGMAEVYRATVLEGPRAGETVALKRMRPELATNPLYARLFRQEGEVALALHHPGIVEVFERGELGGVLYIAMEYVDGFDLRQIIAECATRAIALPIDFACYIAHAVACALAYAHDAPGPDGTPFGLVHRDINPANVFISAGGEVKLGDFGVAQLAALPNDGALAGKAPYQAPEHFTDGAVSPAIDVFGLGAMLYEMLTNRLAFAAPTVRQVYDRITRGAVDPVATLRRDVPSALADVVHRAISPRPPSGHGSWLAGLRRWGGPRPPPRYATPGELAAALEPLFDPAIGNRLAIAAVVRGLFGRNRR